MRVRILGWLAVLALVTASVAPVVGAQSKCGPNVQRCEPPCDNPNGGCVGMILDNLRAFLDGLALDVGDSGSERIVECVKHHPHCLIIA